MLDKNSVLSIIKCMKCRLVKFFFKKCSWIFFRIMIDQNIFILISPIQGYQGWRLLDKFRFKKVSPHILTDKNKQITNKQKEKKSFILYNFDLIESKEYAIVLPRCLQSRQQQKIIRYFFEIVVILFYSGIFSFVCCFMKD